MVTTRYPQDQYIEYILTAVCFVSIFVLLLLQFDKISKLIEEEEISNILLLRGNEPLGEYVLVQQLWDMNKEMHFQCFRKSANCFDDGLQH